MSVYQWLIQPLTGLTNERIATELAALGKIDESVERSDGDGFGKYLVDRGFLKVFLCSRDETFRFRVYGRYGYGMPEQDMTRFVANWYGGKLKTSNPVRKAKSDLKRVGAD